MQPLRDPNSLSKVKLPNKYWWCSKNYFGFEFCTVMVLNFENPCNKSVDEPCSANSESGCDIMHNWLPLPPNFQFIKPIVRAKHLTIYPCKISTMAYTCGKWCNHWNPSYASLRRLVFSTLQVYYNFVFCCSPQLRQSKPGQIENNHNQR